MATRGKCLALLETGGVCLADAVPGLRYCREHVSLRGKDRALVGQALRQAMRSPDRYLAAALAEWPDEDLAAALGADPASVWQLRLAGWPRLDRWADALAELAALVGTDAYLLGEFLQARGIASG